MYTTGATNQIGMETSLLGQDRSKYSRADTVICSVGGYHPSVGGYRLPLPNIEPIVVGTHSQIFVGGIYSQPFVSGNEPGQGDYVIGTGSLEKVKKSECSDILRR